jgi:hypothetical protein
MPNWARARTTRPARQPKLKYKGIMSVRLSPAGEWPDEQSTAKLAAEISAFESLREQLQKDHPRKWALVYKGKREGLYSTFPDAAEDAAKWFGSGSFLIRQIEPQPIGRVLNGPWRDLIASIIAPRKLGLSSLLDQLVGYAQEVRSGHNRF